MRYVAQVQYSWRAQSPLPQTDIHTADEVLDGARDIVDSIDDATSVNEWIPIGTYHLNPGSKYNEREQGLGIQVVQVFNMHVSPKESGDPKWTMRWSEHQKIECSFEEFWDGLGKDHSVQEVK